MMKVGDKYEGFTVTEIVDVPDCASKGIYLKHQRTGLEVFHLLNDDPENLFAFAFRTPSADSTGVAHVLEHSVLCGSAKYPLRDAFIRLSNQNISTYLNAFTACDRTVFPSSTVIKKEYFNLMSVYGDAVFFPLLKPEVFLQECHRIEFDAKGKPTLQGVVYNEMKGNYSSFDGVAGDEIESVLLETSSYAKDSGGDPLEIPNLTLKKLKAFHKKYYCPANCLLFLYGNIPTEEQLSFVNKEILSRIKSAGKKAKLSSIDYAVPIPHRVKRYGPSASDGSDGKTVVACAWQIGRGVEKEDGALFPMELMFLDELIFGDDCAPVAKALLDSQLGESIAPQSGMGIQSRYPTMTIALQGADVKDAKKIEKLVFQSLENLCKNGIPKDDIDRACMTFDFSNREIKRFQGPYSLVLMRKTLRAWTYGIKAHVPLLARETFAKIKERLNSDPNYLPSLIRKYLLENERYSLVSVEPSESWSKKRTQAEKKIIAERVKSLGKEEILRLQNKLSSFQNYVPTKEEEEILPRLSVSEIEKKIDKSPLKKTLFNGINLFSTEINTNGIIYAQVAFPVDTLPASEYPYIPLLASACTEVGYGNMSWHEAQSKVQKITGGFGSHPRTAAVPECSYHLIEEKEYVGREWLVFTFKALEENMEQSFDLLYDFLTKTDFHDTKRLKDIIDSDCNGLFSSVVPHAHWFMSTRTTCKLSRNCAVREIWDGIRSLYFLKEISKENIKKLASHLDSLLKKIRKGGAVINLTADKACLNKAKKLLPAFIEKAEIVPLKKRFPNKDKDFYALTEIPSEFVKETGKKNPLCDELFLAPGTVAYASSAIKSSSYGTKECVAEDLYAHNLENGDLWKKIRVQGGAYGVYFSSVSDNNMTRFMTYRDPKPFDSLKSFYEALENSSGREFESSEVEKCITGCYSYDLEPLSPSSRGGLAFLRELYGVKDATRAKRMKWMLSITSKDLKKASISLGKHEKVGINAVLCGKELFDTNFSENSGKIIKIPL